MSALLVLLFLLSVGTIASRPGAVAGFVDRVATPLLIITGVASAPAGLAVLSPSLVHGLEPALAVGVTWIGILVGLRSASHDFSDSKGNVRAALVVVVSTGSSVLLAMAAMTVPKALGFRFDDSFHMIAGAALLLGGALVGSPPVDAASRADLAMRSHLVDVGDLVATVCAVVAIAILPSWSALTPELAATVVVGGGLLLALVQRLLGGSATDDAATRIIALLGVVAVAAGLLHAAGLPSALSGLVAGVVLSRTELGKALREGLSPTERPARIVVAFLVGTMIPLSTTAFVVGVLLALGQLGVQLVATSWAVGHRPSTKALASGLTSSAVPLVVAASYALAGFPEGELLLATAAVAVVTTDLSAAAIAVVGRLLTHAPKPPSPTPPSMTPPGAVASSAVTPSPEFSHGG